MESDDPRLLLGVFAPDRVRSIVVVTDDGELAVAVRETVPAGIAVVRDARPDDAEEVAAACLPWPWMVVGATEALTPGLASVLRTRPVLTLWLGAAPAGLPAHAVRFDRPTALLEAIEAACYARTSAACASLREAVSSSLTARCCAARHSMRSSAHIRAVSRLPSRTFRSVSAALARADAGWTTERDGDARASRSSPARARRWRNESQPRGAHPRGRRRDARRSAKSFHAQAVSSARGTQRVARAVAAGEQPVLEPAGARDRRLGPRQSTRPGAPAAATCCRDSRASCANVRSSCTRRTSTPSTSAARSSARIRARCSTTSATATRRCSSASTGCSTGRSAICASTTARSSSICRASTSTTIARRSGSSSITPTSSRSIPTPSTKAVRRFGEWLREHDSAVRLVSHGNRKYRLNVTPSTSREPHHRGDRRAAARGGAARLRRATSSRGRRNGTARDPAPSHIRCATCASSFARGPRRRTAMRCSAASSTRSTPPSSGLDETHAQRVRMLAASLRLVAGREAGGWGTTDEVVDLARAGITARTGLAVEPVTGAVRPVLAPEVAALVLVQLAVNAERHDAAECVRLEVDKTTFRVVWRRAGDDVSGHDRPAARRTRALGPRFRAHRRGRHRRHRLSAARARQRRRRGHARAGRAPPGAAARRRARRSGLPGHPILGRGDVARAGSTRPAAGRRLGILCAAAER